MDKIFSLFDKPSKPVYSLLIMFLVIISFVLWQFTTPSIIPKPVKILEELKWLIIHKSLIYELISTTITCFKAIFYSSLIALSLSYLGIVISFFRPISFFVTKMRFWTLMGFSAIILFLTPDTNSFKTVMLIFGITPFLVTGFNASLESIENSWYHYAQTLKLSKLEIFWNVVIRKSAPELLSVIRQNFAIAWIMIIAAEVAVRDQGGIGQVLYDSSTRFIGPNGYARPFAVQLIILLMGINIDYLLMLIRRKLFPYVYLKTDK